ncbi:MAG: hypothetical protein H0V54_12295 [Chthoniobacterales bacterium]|nr:hypothetical protein [Chthoniobacterales bacterium]
MKTDVLIIGGGPAEFQKHKMDREEFFHFYLPQVNPDLTRRMENIEYVAQVHVIPNYSFQVRGFCGKGFICLGDAHRFIDPIFSFGISAALREAEFAIPHIMSYLRGERRDEANPFDAFRVIIPSARRCGRLILPSKARRNGLNAVRRRNRPRRQRTLLTLAGSWSTQSRFNQ